MTPSNLAAIVESARTALCTRRYPPDLLAQIDALPADVLVNEPWLALFQGRRLCRLHSRFAEANQLIHTALEGLQASGSQEDQLWALAEQVVMCYHLRDLKRGLTLVEAVIDQPMRPYLRAELEFGRFLCLIGDEFVQESVVAGEAALAALAKETDLWLQRSGMVQILRNIAAGYHYTGQMRRAVAAAEQAVVLAESEPDLASALPWCWYELGLAYWRQGRMRHATEALEKARGLAEQWHHQQLWSWAVAIQGHILRDVGRIDAALAAYHLAGGWGEVPEGPALLQIRQDRLIEARWSCQVIAERSEGLWRDAGSQVLLAIVELCSGRPEAALELLRPVPSIYDKAGFAFHAATARLYQAAAALALDATVEAAENLAGFLHFAAREEVLTCAWWVPELIEPLLIFALRKGIEADWAQHLLEVRFLRTPDLPESNLSLEDATELAIARRSQLALLPEAPPHMPGLDIAAIVRPAASVGGDFVGYFPFGAQPDVDHPRAFGVAVGDISGKGLGAALLLSGAVVALNTVAADAAPPRLVAHALHTAMQPYTTRSRMNIALCYTLLTDLGDGWDLRAVGCGSVPPLIRRTNGLVEWLDTAGLPLGTLTIMSYQEVRTTLRPGETLLLMSDGVIEALDAQRNLFGFERLADSLARLPRAATAHQILGALLDAVAQHTGGQDLHDDLTLVVLRAHV